MITSTVLTLVVIPAIYYLWRAWQVRREAGAGRVRPSES
jgi:Cu/Ag efflux pump CusA